MACDYTISLFLHLRVGDYDRCLDILQQVTASQPESKTLWRRRAPLQQIVPAPGLYWAFAYIRHELRRPQYPTIMAVWHQLIHTGVF